MLRFHDPSLIRKGSNSRTTVLVTLFDPFLIRVATYFGRTDLVKLPDAAMIRENTQFLDYGSGIVSGPSPDQDLAQLRCSYKFRISIRFPNRLLRIANNSRTTFLERLSHP